MIDILQAGRGTHRLTYTNRAARAWTRIRFAGVPFAAVIMFWVVVDFAAGIVTAWVWTRAL